MKSTHGVPAPIEILLSADTPAAISKSMGLAMIGFADYFAEAKPDDNTSLFLKTVILHLSHFELYDFIVQSAHPL